MRRSNIDAATGSVEEIARIVAQICRRWRRIRILVRGETLMALCKVSRVDYVFGLAGNDRLEKRIIAELIAATIESIRTSNPARCFTSATHA